MYTHRHKNVRDVDTFNMHIADKRVTAVENQDKEPLTSEDVKIRAYALYYADKKHMVRKMRKHACYFPSYRSHPWNKNLQVCTLKCGTGSMGTRVIRNQTPIR